MDDKEKIISIIAPYVSAFGEDAAIADALIAANIGDVTEWKERVECAKRILQIPTLPNGTTDLSYFEYKGERIQDIARQRDEYRHRAEIAEKALKLVSECDELSDAFCEARGGEDCDFRCNTCLYNYFLKQAEREIEEEKGSWKPTGVAKLKLSLASEVIVKSENANAECKAKPIDEVTCRATLSDNELKDASRVLYLVSRLYQNLISEVAVKGMCGEEDKTE